MMKPQNHTFPLIGRFVELKEPTPCIWTNDSEQLAVCKINKDYQEKQSPFIVYWYYWFAASLRLRWSGY